MNIFESIPLPILDRSLKKFFQIHIIETLKIRNCLIESSVMAYKLNNFFKVTNDIIMNAPSTTSRN